MVQPLRTAGTCAVGRDRQAFLGGGAGAQTVGGLGYRLAGRPAFTDPAAEFSRPLLG